MFRKMGTTVGIAA